MDPFSTLEDPNWIYISSTGNRFQDTGRFSKLSYLGMKSGIWQKFWKLQHIDPLSTPVTFFVQSFCMKPGNWKHFARSCTWTLYLCQGVEIELSFALLAAVSEIRADFQTFHIRTWNLEFEICQGSCMWTLFLHKWIEINLIFTLRTAVSDIRAHFQHCHICAWKLEFKKNLHKLNFLPKYMSLFSLYKQRFTRYGPIFKISIFGAWNLEFELSSRSWLFLPQLVEIELILVISF